MGKGIVKLGEGNWAVKDGNLLAAKETNGRFKNAEFTVARGTRATYVGRDGLIKESNLQDVNLVPSIITTENNNGGVINYISGNIYSSTSDGTSTSIIRPRFNFNTESGKTYKLVVTPTGTITGTVNFKFYDGSSYLFQDYDFTTTKEIYFTDNGGVFGAFDGQQTYSINSFTISVQEIKTDTPRIDFTDNTDGHLLLEPQSTNLVPYSEDFSQNSILGGTILSDNIISPDGALNGNVYKEDTNTSQHRIRKDVSVSTGTYTMSCFVKGTDRFVSFYPQGAGTAYAIFDIDNELITNTGGANYVNSIIEDYGNGWSRCSLTYNVSLGNSLLHIYLSNNSSIPAPSYLGNESEMSFYGLQLEEGSFATSYIPTNGSTVTRDAETCTGAGEAADFNSEEGVLYAEIAALVDDATNRCIALSDGTADDRITLLFGTSSNRIRAIVKSNGSTSFDEEYTVTSTLDYHKVAIKYKANDFALWIDGVERFTDTSGDIFAQYTLDELSFNIGGDLFPFYGKCKAIRVYKEALSDSELTTLTS